MKAAQNFVPRSKITITGLAFIEDSESDEPTVDPEELKGFDGIKDPVDLGVYWHSDVGREHPDLNLRNKGIVVRYAAGPPRVRVESVYEANRKLSAAELDKLVTFTLHEWTLGYAMKGLQFDLPPHLDTKCVHLPSGQADTDDITVAQV